MAALTVDVAMEDLPPIRPNELKIIGRCVRFRCECVVAGTSKPFIFEGMVAMITRDTVVLMNSVRLPHDGDLTAPLDLAALRGGQLPSSATRRIPNDGKMGIIPFSTFLRRRIRQVEFAEEKPHHLCFSKFSNPSLYFADMQHLRMFVRRYLVHTSQGNNANKMALRGFLTARLQWADPENNVLPSVIHEELANMVAVDKEIVERQQAAAAVAGGAHHAGRQHGDGGAVAGRFNSPQSVFLFRSRVPSRTSYVAISHLVFSIGLLLYSASVFTSSERLLVLPFIRQVGLFVIVAGAAHLLAGIMTGVHGLRMQVPLEKRPLAIRAAAVLAAGALVAVALFSVIMMTANHKTPSGGSMERFYMDLIRSSPADICQFQYKAACGGFSSLCSRAPSQCPSTCVSSSRVLCSDPLKEKVRDALAPLLSILIIESVAIFLDILLFVQLLRIAG
jgi:hypothetical protein